MNTNNTVKKPFLFILFLLFLAAVGAYLVLFIKNQSSKKIGFVQSPTPTIMLSRGEINFGKEKEVLANINESIDQPVFVDSKNNNIVGYDLSIEYDSQYLKFVKVDNLMADRFDFFSSTKNNQIVASGIKKLSYQKEIRLDNSQIVKLQFQVIKKGKTFLKLIRRDNDKSESNLITENNTDILDEVTNIPIIIDETISLKKNTPVIINGMRLILTDFGQGSSSCRDCLTYAKISIEKANEKKELNFKIGGFAGYLINRLSFDKYYFILKEVRVDSVDLVVYEI